MDVKREYSGEAKLTFAIGIGLEVTLSPDKLSVVSSITGSVTGSLKVMQGNPVDGQLELNIGKIAGTVEIVACLGTIPWTDIEVGLTYKKEVVFFDGWTFPSDKFAIISASA